MRKWVLIVLCVAACSRAPSMGTSMTGAASPSLAATMFLGAVKAQDLQAMSAVWGTTEGAARDHMERAVLDQRLVILQQCYDHDRAQILDDRPTPDGVGRIVRVQITRGNRTKTPQFKMGQGPSSRWYVFDTDFPTMQEFCSRSH